MDVDAGGTIGEFLLLLELQIYDEFSIDCEIFSIHVRLWRAFRCNKIIQKRSARSRLQAIDRVWYHKNQNAK